MPEATAAVLGTGRMGAAMAERLASQGVAVIVYNRSPERAVALAERIGATVAATPAAAAAAADVTISMVAPQNLAATSSSRGVIRGTTLQHTTRGREPLTVSTPI